MSEKAGRPHPQDAMQASHGAPVSVVVVRKLIGYTSEMTYCGPPAYRSIDFHYAIKSAVMSVAASIFSSCTPPLKNGVPCAFAAEISTPESA
jgi:hypothetical protein